MSSVGFLKPFQPAQATYNMTVSEEELMQETLVLENAQRPELHIWAHPERGIHELLESWNQHMSAVVLSTTGSVLLAGKQDPGPRLRGSMCLVA